MDRVPVSERHRYCGGYYDAHTCEEIDSLIERAEKAEAQVQAVRELPILGKAPQGNTALRGYNDGWNACRMATLRALDGDSDE